MRGMPTKTSFLVTSVKIVFFVTSDQKLIFSHWDGMYERVYGFLHECRRTKFWRFQPQSWIIKLNGNNLQQFQRICKTRYNFGLLTNRRMFWFPNVLRELLETCIFLHIFKFTFIRLTSHSLTKLVAIKIFVI